MIETKVRCINRQTNKVKFFSPYIAQNPMQMKRLGFEVEQLSKPQLVYSTKAEPIEEKINAETIIDEFVQPEIKVKRKYTKRKK